MPVSVKSISMVLEAEHYRVYTKIVPKNNSSEQQ